MTAVQRSAVAVALTAGAVIVVALVRMAQPPEMTPANLQPPTFSLPPRMAPTRIGNDGRRSD